MVNHPNRGKKQTLAGAAFHAAVGAAITRSIQHTPAPEVQTQPTPGPWYATGTGNHQGLIISEATGANVAVAYDKKDAPLLAAAPDLLEALQAMYDGAAELPAVVRGSHLHESMEQARAAIAKATQS